MYFATSLDGGKNFGEAAKLGKGTWPLKMCPMDGGAIATSGDRFVTAWRRDKTIYLTTTGDSTERSLGLGEQPWAALTKAGPFAVWVTKRGESAYFLSPAGRMPKKLADRATDPVIAAGPDGVRPVVAVWESQGGDTPTIQCLVLAD
jgi:hypothetical protein